MSLEQFTESVVEQAALAWLDGLRYTVQFGPAIAPGEAVAERDDYAQVVLPRRLRDMLLPKPISGALRVLDAERSMEAAA